jgi:hypothetical protein
MQNRALSMAEHPFPPSPMAIDHTSFQQVFSKIFPFQTLQKLIRKNKPSFHFQSLSTKNLHSPTRRKRVRGFQSRKVLKTVRKMSYLG